MNILKSSTFFFFFFLSLTERFQTTFVRKTPKSTFSSFFLESDRIFFQKKLVRQVIKLEWPNFEKNSNLSLVIVSSVQRNNITF